MTVYDGATKLVRSANPERPIMGRGLPTMCRGLPAEGCPQWSGRGLWHKISGFSLRKGDRLLGRSVLVFSLNLVGPTYHITKMHKICRKTTANKRILLTLGKEISKLNISVTTAKYFHTSDIIFFGKGLIVSTLIEKFFGFLVETQMKAYTKLTVVMCCYRRSVAPCSGDFHWRLQVTAPAGATGGVVPR